MNRKKYEEAYSKLLDMSDNLVIALGDRDMFYALKTIDNYVKELEAFKEQSKYMEDDLK